jgi:sulfite exporter TauE/SafE
MFLALLTAGSAARGAEVALAFGVGTVPLLWVAQHGFHRLRGKLTPVGMARMQRGLALVTAVVLAWRMHGTLPFGKEEIVQEKKELPSCCH